MLSLLLLTIGWGGFRRRAVGRNGEATLVTDQAVDSPAVLAVKAAIGPDVVTVRTEPAFQLDIVPGARFREVRSWRNLIFIADLDRSDATTALVERTVARPALADLRAGRRCYALYGDVWAHGQTVLVLAAPGEPELARAVAAQGDAIYAAFEARVTREIQSLLYLAGEEKGLARDLARRYG